MMRILFLTVHSAGRLVADANSHDCSVLQQLFKLEVMASAGESPAARQALFALHEEVISPMDPPNAPASLHADAPVQEL
jgi:hypothetical protein